VTFEKLEPKKKRKVPSPLKTRGLLLTYLFFKSPYTSTYKAKPTTQIIVLEL
jgi:hypothetical protein